MTTHAIEDNQNRGLEPSAMFKNLGLVVAYIVVSTCLIRFNKFLINEERFPFAMFLTACHMSLSFSLSLLLYIVRPSAFPGVVASQGQSLLVMKWMVPIGVAFAVSLFASNQAYMYCSVSFLQFMKEGSIILCFLMSCAVGLQSMNRVRLAIILWIFAGTAMAVNGELHFVAVGVLFQLASQFAECARAVMGEIVLGGSGLRLDPLSYTLFVAPTCLIVLIIGNVVAWHPAIPGALAIWWPYMIPNALLAFALNIIVANVIKEISAVGFILAGIFKDIVIVLFSCIYFGEVVTAHQVSGFMIAMIGVFFWSYLKVSPDSQAAALAARLLVMPVEKEPNERTALTRPEGKV